MTHSHRAVCRLLCLSLATALLAVAAPAMAQDHGQAAGGDDASVSGISGTTVADLHQLMADKALTELRTTYNGTYGASLLFYAKQMTYYVVLFHNKDFWRVIKTSKVAKAESVYATFSKQSRKLAQVDIDTIRLEAGRKYAQRLLSEKNQHLATLRQDLQRQRKQAQRIAQDQQHGKQEAIQLTQALKSSNQQLEALRAQLQQLQARQADLQMQLPKVQQQRRQAMPAPAPASSAPAAASAGTAPRNANH